ncbi:MAG: DUF3488 and transglutaminase-like domain-containing protein [Lysobacterales bacterium]|jgi:transglutaminase-like putative cysteine protease
MMRPAGHKTAWFTLATFTLAAFPQMLHMPLPVLAITLVPIGLRAGTEQFGWKPLPGWVRHILTALALVLLFTSYGDLSGRRSAVSLLTVMLSLKMIEGYRIRDARLVVSFSLFLCATQFLFAQGILMLFYAAGTTILALIALARLQRQEAWGATAEPPALKASVWSELRFGLRLLALALPVGLAFFLLFPRLASPLWGIPETTLDSRTGLSDSMAPGSIQQLFMDDSPAFRVVFDGDLPPPEALYWRGPVFWQFDGRTWTSGFYGRNLEAATRPEPGPGEWDYSVQIEPNERKWLFALDYPIEAPPDTRLTSDFQLLRRDPVLQLMEYRIRSNPRFVDSPELPRTLRSLALELPEGYNPKTRSLVESWRSEYDGDEALVRHALDYFHNEPFHYSLDAPGLGHDSVDEFLFDTREGFCEHYASAFAVMMRMAGIPTRVVTGYMGGWYNTLGHYMLVRQSDAHAWTEVWLPETGWSRVDPTAAVSPTRIRSGALGALAAPRHLFDFPWVRRLRNSADIVQQRWNDWVIEYGARSQARLFDPLGLKHASAPILIAILAAATALLTLAVFPLVMRTRGPGRKDPVQNLWRRFLKRLKAAGYEAPPSSGALELAAAAGARLPGHAQAIHRIAELYTLSRYAPRPPPLEALREALRAFRPKRSPG